MTVDPTRIDVAFDPRVRRIEGIARHGMTPFSCPLISEVADNLWVGGCIDLLLLPAEIVHVVSLYRWEQYHRHDGVRSFLEVTMYDAEGPFDPGAVLRLARWVNECRADGPTLVHCQAGLNRSNLVAAAALVLAGAEAADAIALLRAKRSPAVLCNRDFEAWVLALDEDKAA